MAQLQVEAEKAENEKREAYLSSLSPTDRCQEEFKDDIGAMLDCMSRVKEILTMLDTLNEYNKLVGLPTKTYDEFVGGNNMLILL